MMPIIGAYSLRGLRKKKLEEYDAGGSTPEGTQLQ